MGKHQNGRKHVQTDRAHTSRDDTLVSEETSNELEARLQRLENAHSSGNTDVYKFAFFFFMGVVLTILVYPRISFTFDTKSVLSTNNLPEKKAVSSINIEQIDELDEIPSEEYVPDVEQGKEGNRTKLLVKRRDADIEETESKDELKLNTREIGKRNSAVEEERKDGNENKRVKDDAEDDFEDRGEPVILKEERVEDLMEDEVSEDKAEPISFSSIQDGTQQTDTESSDGEEPRTIELFSANAENLINERPVEIKQVDTRDEKPEPKKKSTKNASKGKKTSQKKSKDKVNKANKSKDNAPPKDNNEDLPKEIKDFKATYQKTVTPKKIFVDGRRIPPMELLPQKPNNSSVK